MPTDCRRRRLRHSACLLSAVVWLCAHVTPASAVPVPYKNCGKAGDILTVSALDASVWPPPTAAPLAGIATIDPMTGQILNLHVFLLFGVDWIFDSGNLPASVSSGFVALPASIPLSVASPVLPVAAGPYNSTHTFVGNNGGASVTVLSKANMIQSLAAPTTSLSLTFNGTPGFPVPPVPGSYDARVQMTIPGGGEVFCFDLALTDISFVTAVSAPQLPALSSNRLLALPFLVAAMGLFALARMTSRI